jgi:hypothetical protein
MHGTIDMLVPPAQTVDCFRRLKARYGRQLDSFSRFYLASGMGHGDGPFVVSWNALGALDHWLEAGQPPGRQVVTEVNAAHNGRSRPLCEYGAWPKYDGHGDPNAAESFDCAFK